MARTEVESFAECSDAGVDAILLVDWKTKPTMERNQILMYGRDDIYQPKCVVSFVMKLNTLFTKYFITFTPIAKIHNFAYLRCK